jgi:hypothetical protein
MPPKSKNQDDSDKSAQPVESSVDTSQTPDPVEVSPEQTDKNKSNLLSVEDVADEVLRGRWGNPVDSRRRLTESGYDADAVEAEVKRRKERGAPSAY